MKKLLALLLAVTMVFGMTACVTEPADDENPQTSLTLPPAVENLKEQVNADVYPLETDTVLRVLFTEDGLGDIAASQLWEETTGVKIENLTWTNEQMFTSLAADDIPDAIVMPWSFSKEKVYEYGASGDFLDFSKHLDKMPNLCALIKQYPEIMEICAYPDGAMYSLPKVGWSNTYQSNLLYIRTDLLEDLGWDHAPATADEFLTFLKEAQAKYSATDPQFVAFMPQNKNYMAWTGMNTISATLFPTFGDLVETGLTVNSENEVTLGAATEQYRYYLEFMHELYNSGAFPTGIFTMDNTASKAVITGGHTAVSMGTYISKSSSPDGIAHVEIMEPLTSKYQGTKQWMKMPDVSFRACVANAKCEDLDTLLAWLDSFYAPMSNPLNKEGTVSGVSISKGVLDVNWSVDHEAKTWTSLESFANYYDTLFGAEIGLYTPTSSLTLKGSGTTEKLYPYAVAVADLQNRIMLSEDDQLDYADIWVDMEKYISQMHAKFINGEEDIETGWDSYISQLNKMGLPEMLEIYQNAYDAK